MDEQGPLTIVLWTTDIQALSEFLERVGGASIDARHPGFASLHIGGSRLELHDDESYRGHPWFNALHREGAARGIGAELRIRVPEVATAYQEAIRRGAVTVQPPTGMDEAVECVVMGPDGYLLSLWQEPA